MRNQSSSHVYAWVQDVSTSQWYTTAGVGSTSRPSGEKVSKSGGTVTFAHLARGNYNVFIRSSSQWSSTLLTTLNVTLSTADQTVVY